MDRLCEFPDCGLVHRARGYCSGHYAQLMGGMEMRAIGSGPSGGGKSRLPRDETFWSKVDKSGKCWIWTGVIRSDGYGLFRYRGYQEFAHRHSLLISTPNRLEGAIVDHLCHQRSCVNPAHLRVTGTAENIQNRSGATRSSSTGVRGVWWERGSWRATVVAYGKRYRKRFPTLQEAAIWAESVRGVVYDIPSIREP